MTVSFQCFAMPAEYFLVKKWTFSESTKMNFVDVTTVQIEFCFIEGSIREQKMFHFLTDGLQSTKLNLFQKKEVVLRKNRASSFANHIAPTENSCFGICLWFFVHNYSIFMDLPYFICIKKLKKAGLRHFKNHKFPPGTAPDFLPGQSPD